MSPFGLAEYPADQTVKKIDGLIGQSRGEIQGNGDQRRMSALPFETDDMLNRGFVGLARELAQAGLVDQVSAAGIDADRSDVFQAFNHAKHGGRPAGLRRSQASQTWPVPSPRLVSASSLLR